MMNRVYLLLGSNLDDREALIASARKAIADQIGTIRQESSVYQSQSWGFDSSQDFLNQVVMVDTSLNSAQVLEAILEIENTLGRIRVPGIYASRTIDIDILFFNDEVIREKSLMVPHPRIQDRRFTLVPLMEINRGLVHPELKKSIEELLVECSDTLDVQMYPVSQ